MDFPHRRGHGHRRDDDDDDRRGPAYGRPDADAAPYGGYGQPPAPAYGRPADADTAPYGGYGQPPPPAFGAADPYARPAYGQPPHLAYGRDEAADPYGRAPPPAYGRDEAADPYGRAPPPAYGGGGYGGNVVHVAHEGGDERPHYGGGGGYGGNVVHVAHEGRDDMPPYGGGGGGYGGDDRPNYGGGYGGRGSAHGNETRTDLGGGGGGYGGNVVHVAHEGGDDRPNYGGGGGGYGGGGSAYGDETRPYFGGGGDGADPTPRKPTYRIFCKAGNDQYSLALRDGKVCLVRTDQDDDSQHWIKDLKYSTRVKDEEGYPAMILVNKATGEALKHSVGKSHPVRVSSYNPDNMDESVLWTESKDVGEGFRCIRMVNNIYLNFDALHGDKDHGGVRDGTTLVLWDWCEGDNQRWKIVPW